MAAWTVIWQMWFDKYVKFSESLFQIVVFYSANLYAIDKYIYANIVISLMIQLVVVSDNFSCLSEWLMCAVHSRELCSWSTLNIQVGNHTSNLNILAGCPCWCNLWWGNQKYQCQFRHQDILYHKTTSQTHPLITRVILLLWKQVIHEYFITCTTVTTWRIIPMWTKRVFTLQRLCLRCCWTE